MRRVLESINSPMAASAFGQFTAANRPQAPIGNPLTDQYAANHMFEWARASAKRARERNDAQEPVHG